MREKLIDLIVEKLPDDVPIDLLPDVDAIVDAILANDVVEVARCKDCKHFKMMGTTPRCNFYKGLATTVDPQTDYCSYGERRER